MKKIIVAGGTGFVGQALIQVLLDAQYHVLCLTRQHKIIRENSRSNLSYIHWDDPAWQTQLEGSEALINLCGASVVGWPWTKKRKQVLYNSRIKPTQTLVKAIKACQLPPKVLINASAVGIYPSGDQIKQQALCTESSTDFDTGFLADLCKAWEAAAFNATPSTRVVCLRLGVVLGQSGGVYQRLRWLFLAGFGHGIGPGTQPFPWVHLQDVTRIILNSVTQPQWEGAVNVVAPKACSFAEFIKAISRQLNRPSWFTLPAWVLRLSMGEMSELFVKGQHVKSEKLPESEFCYQTLQNALVE